MKLVMPSLPVGLQMGIRFSDYLMYPTWKQSGLEPKFGSD